MRPLRVLNHLSSFLEAFLPLPLPLPGERGFSPAPYVSRPFLVSSMLPPILRDDDPPSGRDGPQQYRPDGAQNGTYANHLCGSGNLDIFSLFFCRTPQ